MSSFEEWYREADIPMKDDKGRWYDAETGLPYQPTCKVKKVARKSVSADTKGFRAYAKQFGGVALTGSMKQKEWAEKIRYNVLTKCDDEQASILCSLAITDKASFWINFRNESAEQLFNRVTEIKRAIREVNKARAAYEATADSRGYMLKGTPECESYEVALKKYRELTGE
ncbi:hypothetical protein QQW93_08065 [Pasteurella multocida]|uniref:hypothetical protein n=1 Tax=Pasteurella multocida TaxID=747 RepID=UPI002D1E93BC|nr:hypothetical protein [Pasteurella multocida]MEB4494305.1 hypothetical protein [Pasteurella multocida]MEB4502013.1 hypothetical protein [Pasteurella multocida]MEB4511734.1 hypothetical protein [Pasteurella multocida]MEB4532236.1 hypothetical protein [Pasteurella multocida]MEB4536485.1 hypothetical protein [Pasteurella multocida]